MNYNYMARCISECENRESCRRAMSKHSAEIDYIRADDDGCKWYNEIVNKIEVTDIGVEKEEDNNE